MPLKPPTLVMQMSFILGKILPAYCMGDYKMIIYKYHPFVIMALSPEKAKMHRDHILGGIIQGSSLIILSWLLSTFAGFDDSCFGCGLFLGSAMILGVFFSTPNDTPGPIIGYIIDDIYGGKNS